MNNEQIAQLCHEANRAYCQSIGDDSQPAWSDAPDWQKQSALLGVQLHASGDHGAEASHESWMKQKLDDGWEYGAEKNPEAKQHPCLVPFSMLPPQQQMKDYLFRSVVHACINSGDSFLTSSFEAGKQSERARIKKILGFAA